MVAFYILLSWRANRYCSKHCWYSAIVQVQTTRQSAQLPMPKHLLVEESSPPDTRLLELLLNLILHYCQSLMLNNQVSTHNHETDSIHKPSLKTIDYSILTFLCLRL